MTGVKDEHTVKTKLSFRRKLLYGISVFFLVVIGWLLWQVFTFNNAVRMAKEAGFSWESDDPITLIREDWRNALKKETWVSDYRVLRMRDVSDLDDYREMLHLLRPAYLYLSSCTKLQNVDGLRNLTSLVELDLQDCIELQNVDGLKGLPALERINLSGCTSLQNVDGLNGLTSLEILLLSNCTELKNVDNLKGLTTLGLIILLNCNKISVADLRELDPAPRDTNIIFPDGTTTPPQ
jgi:hypothetical protein